jgi:hypothetical protein
MRKNISRPGRQHLLLCLFILLMRPAAGFAQDNQVTATDLFHAFNQTGNGNCVAVAYIKAAIWTFGLDSIFKVKYPDSTVPFKEIIDIKNDGTKNYGGTIDVTFKNGDIVQITFDELKVAMETSKFFINTTTERYRAIALYALLSYAAMIKERQKIDSIADYKTAAEVMGKGASSKDAWRYLGLDSANFEEVKNYQNLNSLGGLVIWRAHHSVFACYGSMNIRGGERPINFVRRLFYRHCIRLKK